jgi:hypothetical protein
MLGFGLYNLLWTGKGLLAATVFAFAGGVLLTWWQIRGGRDGRPMYRINAALFAALLFYMLMLGGEGGSMSQWVFTFPLATLFLLGIEESLYWNSTLLLGVLGVFWAMPSAWKAYPYAAVFKTRFVAVYLIVWIFASWFEYLRQHYRRGLEAEHRQLLEERAALQEALSHVKQLSGLLPICASCKKVRDDQGYWRQIEAYISARSEAAFSHGLCPDCGKIYFPGSKLGPGPPE